MTITITWWMLPIAFVLIGFVLALIFGRSAGDYDFVSPLIFVGFLLMGIVAAIGVLIGRWLQ